MFKQQHLSTRLQHADGFAKQLLARPTRWNLVRAESEAHRLAGSVGQRNVKVFGPVALNARIRFRRHFQIAHVRHRFLRRFAFHVPAIYRFNLCLRQHVGEKKCVSVRADMQVRYGHVALHPAQVHQPAHILHSRMPVHAVQTKQRVRQQQQPDFCQSHCPPESHRHAEQHSDCPERNAHCEKNLRNFPVVAPAHVHGPSPIPPR